MIELAEVDTNKDIAIKQTVSRVLMRMDSLRIVDDSEMLVAAEWLKDCKAVQAAVKAHFEPDRQRTYDAYKAVTDEIKKTVTVLEQAESKVKRMLSEYEQEQERKRREEQARLEAEAKAIAEDAALAEAINTGDESVLDEPLMAPVVAQDRPLRAEGVSYASNWGFEIVDAAAIPREYLMVDEKKIRGVVKAMKAQTNIPGVKVYESKTVKVRS